jgi:hypothetical protein
MDRSGEGDERGGGRARSRALIVAGAAIVATVLAAVVVGTVVALGDGSGGGDARADANRADANQVGGPDSTRSGPTTTATLPAATSDPDAPVYQGVPLPSGVNATIDTCAWSPAHGGELQASGAIASGPDNDGVWMIDVVWLQNDRELDSQADLFAVPPGQTTAWRFTAEASLPPADLRCALEVS